MGCAVVETGGQRKTAACIGGMLSVRDGNVTLVPTTFEWAEAIDVSRAERAHEKALALIEQHKQDKAALRLAESKLRRALVRKSVAESAQNQ
jgi:F-type H+-transporting ATPase subunit epsilon